MLQIGEAEVIHDLHVRGCKFIRCLESLHRLRHVPRAEKPQAAIIGCTCLLVRSRVQTPVQGKRFDNMFRGGNGANVALASIGQGRCDHPPHGVFARCQRSWFGAEHDAAGKVTGVYMPIIRRQPGHDVIPVYLDDSRAGCVV